MSGNALVEHRKDRDTLNFQHYKTINLKSLITCSIILLSIISVSSPKIVISDDSLFVPVRHIITASSTKEEIRSLIVSEYGERMAKIVNCESGFDINRHNYKDPNGGSYGLFQINAPWIPTAKKMGLDIMKPDDNFKFAKHILKVQGLKAWSCNKLV